MDREIKRNNIRKELKIAVFVIVAVFILIFLRFIFNESSSTYRVSKESLTFASVQVKSFENFIPVRGTILPRTTVYLESVDGGLIAGKFKEEGAIVEKGEKLLEFSNTDLRLRVSQTDAQITEQINLLKNTLNDLDEKKLSTERELINVDYKITTLKRQKDRNDFLFKENKLISKKEYLEVLDELNYQKKLYKNLMDRQKIEEGIRKERGVQIAEQIKKLDGNLAAAMETLELLTVRAPISGQLTSFDVEIGFNKIPGQRLGQIDVLGEMKIEALVDEYYVANVKNGQIAQMEIAGKRCFAKIEKVYPDIQNGRFKVDLIFDETPKDMRRGQTLQLELELGEPSDATLLSTGGYMRNGKDGWVYVLTDNGSYAEKRKVKIGRTNARYSEILYGLNSGDTVVISDYDKFGNVERLELTN